ncbi:hypothetical protein CgunFtcFv8_001161 [Champsocephalus gunnari]|uniref:Uncharacterized protein n=1 Tax=Champsocephalus gunnari TaxID=52237 RepID=A0AAN8DLP2_CHAGU|nr:hypothetical protein CgunFtcFv8_001161 [Champsocephalus gunnari]
MPLETLQQQLKRTALAGTPPPPEAEGAGGTRLLPAAEGRGNGAEAERRGEAGGRQGQVREESGGSE